MKAPVIVVFLLTLIYIVSGISVARDSTIPAVWLGASIPGLAMIYLTFRVWRDNRDAPK